MLWAGGRRLRPRCCRHLDGARWRVRRHGWHFSRGAPRNRARRDPPGSPPGIQVRSGQTVIGCSSGNALRVYQTKRRGLAVPRYRPYRSRCAHDGGIQRRRVFAPERSAAPRHVSGVLHTTEPIFESTFRTSRLSTPATRRLKCSLYQRSISGGNWIHPDSAR